jgi:emfourin
VRTGGVAGVRLATTVDSATLAAREREWLERRIAESGLDRLPEKPAKAAPDRFLYRLTVEGPGAARSVVVGEDDVADTLRPLVEWLVARARAPVAVRRRTR